MTLRELKIGGYVEGIRDAGFSIEAMKKEHYLPFECKRAGYDFDEASYVGYMGTRQCYDNEWQDFNKW